MKTTTLFLEKGQYVGSRIDEREWAWPNLALFCTECGDIWGRVIYEEGLPRISAPKWQLINRLCVRHGDGQFLHHMTVDAADYDLLKRELLALLNGVTE